ncbi:hypothetical protein SD1617_5588 [Shigella dysenteriae 1617]|nr:hypothetical protein SD1617_5588 [Shigella dysenteriae 1617]
MVVSAIASTPQRSTKKSSGRLLKNTCSTNWKHHQKIIDFTGVMLRD